MHVSFPFSSFLRASMTFSAENVFVNSEIRANCAPNSKPVYKAGNVLINNGREGAFEFLENCRFRATRGSGKGSEESNEVTAGHGLDTKRIWSLLSLMG